MVGRARRGDASGEREGEGRVPSMSMRLFGQTTSIDSSAFSSGLLAPSSNSPPLPSRSILGDNGGGARGGSATRQSTQLSFSCRRTPVPASTLLHSSLIFPSPVPGGYALTNIALVPNGARMTGVRVSGGKDTGYCRSAKSCTTGETRRPFEAKEKVKEVDTAVGGIRGRRESEVRAGGTKTTDEPSRVGGAKFVVGIGEARRAEIKVELKDETKAVYAAWRSPLVGASSACNSADMAMHDGKEDALRLAGRIMVGSVGEGYRLGTSVRCEK